MQGAEKFQGKSYSEVPPEYRYYVDEEEESKFRAMGVPIYEGPHGGKFIDRRDLIRHGERNPIEVSSTNIIKLKQYYDALLERGSIDSDEMKNVIAALNWVRFKGMARKVGDLSVIDDKIAKVEKLDINSLNRDILFKVQFKDGTYAYMKKLFPDEMIEVRVAGITGHIVSNMLEKIVESDVLKKLLPKGRLVNYNGDWYFMTDEVYGVLGVNARDKLKDIDFNSDDMIDLMAGLIVIGLGDLHFANVFYEPNAKIIIPFDFDFAGSNIKITNFGPLDFIARVDKDKFKDLDFRKLADKVVEKFEKYNGELRQYLSDEEDVLKTYINADERDVDFAIESFYEWFNRLGKIVQMYKDGMINGFGMLVNVGSARPKVNIRAFIGDDLFNELINDFSKAAKVPAEYRLYINNWQAQRFRRKGIKVYRGPRGGLYVDIRELKNRGVNTDEVKVVEEFKPELLEDSKNLNAIIARVAEEPKLRVAVVNELRKGIDYMIEKLIDYKLGQNREEYLLHYRRAVNAAFVLNALNGKAMANDMNNDNYKVVSFSDVGAQPGVINVTSMFIGEFLDGSHIFAKELTDDAEWVVNNYVAPALIKVLVGREYSDFIPTPRIIVKDGRVFVGTSEVYGVTGMDLMGIQDIELKNVDRFMDFLAAHYVVGLDDSHESNYFIDPENGVFVQFDVDYAFMRGGTELHIGTMVEKLAEWYGFDATEVKRRGIEKLLQKEKEIMFTIRALRASLDVYDMPEDKKEIMKKGIDRAGAFMFELIRKAKKDPDEAIRYLDSKI